MNFYQSFLEHGPAPSPDTVSPGEYQHETTLMDRAYGSHSSAASISDHFSAVLFPDYGDPHPVPQYATSLPSPSNAQQFPYSLPASYPSAIGGRPVLDPVSQAGSTPSSFLTNGLVYPLSTKQDLEIEECQRDEEDGISLPIFDIETQGDPNIKWYMYYNFNVTKTEACWELKPGYKITENFPSKKDAEKSFTEGGKRNHPCLFQDCGAKPFGRHHDLERHFRTVHRDPRAVDSKNVDEVQCDYTKCGHTNFLRKDHAREHYREYHKEDLMKRLSRREPEKPKGVLQKWWESRLIFLKWWRCSGCLKRVKVSESQYQCSLCDKLCEAERVQFRMKLSQEKEASKI